MKENIILYNLFSLCSDKNKFIYEISNFFNSNELTLDELEYWNAYNIIENARIYDINYTELNFDEVQDALIRKAREDERRRKQ